MRKLIPILLLFTLFMSWTTGAVAFYCKHEIAPSAQKHLGHHADSFNGHDKNKNNQPLQEKGHSHCGLSTLFTGKIPLQPAIVFSDQLTQQMPYPTVTSPLLSATVREPERPKWPTPA